MWRDGNRISFQCKVVESGHIVLSGGYVDLKDITDAKKTIPVSYLNSMIESGVML